MDNCIAFNEVGCRIYSLVSILCSVRPDDNLSGRLFGGLSDSQEGFESRMELADSMTWFELQPPSENWHS